MYVADSRFILIQYHIIFCLTTSALDPSANIAVYTYMYRSDIESPIVIAPIFTKTYRLLAVQCECSNELIGHLAHPVKPFYITLITEMRRTHERVAWPLCIPDVLVGCVLRSP
jgi:hypothetical protein